MTTLPPPSPWRSVQMRGLGASYRMFTAHSDDVARYKALPWHRRLRSLETWLRGQYGDVIYHGGRYERGATTPTASAPEVDSR